MDLQGVQLHDKPPGDDSIDLIAFAEIFFKRLRVIFLISLAGLLLSICIYFLIPKKFSSTARILPPKQDQGIMGLMMSQMGGMAGLAGDILGKGTASDLYVGMLNSEAVKDSIINRFKLIEVYDKDSRLETYNKLDKRVDINAGKKDGIISITVEDKDPKRAADMANAYVYELGKLSVRLNISGASENRNFLEERLAKAKGDLTKAENDLKRFQSQTNALDITEQTKGTIKGIAELSAQLAVEEVKLAALLRAFTESSIEVKNQRAIISGIKSQIARMETGTKHGGALPSISAVPALGQDYVRLMREFKIQETIVELLTKQYEITKINEAKQVDGVQLIQPATVPDKHISPRPSAIILGGTFTAFLAALCLVYAQHMISTMPSELKHRFTNILKSSI